MILTKGLLYAASNYPEQLAVIEDHHRYSYRQLEQRTAKLKSSLVALGVKKGDRVALLMLNDFRYVELMYAITALGAIVVPLNIRFSVTENIYVLNDAAAEVLFIHTEFLPALATLKDQVPAIQHVVLAEDRDVSGFTDYSNVLSYEELLEKETVEVLDFDGVEEEDVAGIFYTGGTTGRSKGVMLTHRNLQVNAFHVAMNLHYKKSDIYLHAGPMFHLADQASTFAVTLAAGTHAILRMFTPKSVLEVIEKEQVTLSMLVPTMVNMLLHSADFDKYDTSSWRMILYGASPMPVELLKLVMTKMPQLQLAQAYGMTEASPILTFLKPEDHRLDGSANQEKRLTSCGTSVQTIEMKIVDDEGNRLPANEIGEMIAKGPIIMKGYWKLPEETAKVLRDGWYYTGDLGYRDDDGYYYVVDRAKDMIISGGENVYSVEVEQALSAHPAVLECAVFGAPSEQWGEVVTAAVVLKEETVTTEQEILAFIRGQIADYKVPKSVAFLTELPKSGAGKILKRVIREQYLVK